MINVLTKPKCGVYLYRSPTHPEYLAAFFTISDEQLKEEDVPYRGYIVLEGENIETFDDGLVAAVMKQGYIFTGFIFTGSSKKEAIGGFLDYAQDFFRSYSTIQLLVGD